MKTNKYKIVVLLDMKDTMQATLISAVSLAKMIHGEIEVFSVLKPTEMVGTENQLSAMRSINSVQTKSNSTLGKIIAPIAKEHGIEINYSYAVGNVKNEISQYLKEHKPNIVVLGKRKTKPFQILGDSINAFVLKSFSGNIMITNHKNVLNTNNPVSLGILNGSESLMGKSLPSQLMAYSDQPLKNYKFVRESKMPDTVPPPPDKKTVDYVFNHNDNTMNNLTNYLNKNKINLLFVDRERGFGAKKSNSLPSDLRRIIGKIDTNILFPAQSGATIDNPSTKDLMNLKK